MNISLSLMTDKNIKRIAKDYYNGSRSVIASLKSNRDLARSRLPEHVQMCLNRAIDSKGNFRTRRELEAYDISNDKKPINAIKNINKTDYMTSPLIIDFQNISGDDIDTYSSALSKNGDMSKNDIAKGILNLKNGGKKYMSTTELLQELRQKQKENTGMEIKQAVGEYYKHHINKSGDRLSFEAKQILNIEDDRGILPKVVRERIVLDYPNNNPLREVMTVTTDDNLMELPIMKYSGTDELELKAESIILQPIHERILARVSESVVLGSETNLTETIESALFSELIAREVNNIFATDPEDKKKHMSLYHNNIEVVTESNVYEAVDKALKDLPQAIRDNSSIVMSLEDYQDVVRHLGTIGLGGLASNPDMIWNKKLVIIDQAVNPVVGDFELLHANYEQLGFGTGKDVKEGIYTVALRLVSDIRVLLPKAFRIAEVDEN